MFLTCCQRSRKLRLFKRLAFVTVISVVLYKLCLQLPVNDLTSISAPNSKHKGNPTFNDRTSMYRHLIPRNELELKVNLALNVFQFANGLWTFNRTFCESRETYSKAMLKNISGNIPIYVYEEDEDIWISKNIIHQGEWKGEWIRKMLDLFKSDKDLVFIDVGANLGMFTLPAAVAGHRVIAIECMSRTFQRLCSSVDLTNVADRVDLVYNAVSSSHGYAELEILDSNKGGTKVSSITNTNAKHHSVPSVLLDDLLSKFNISKAVVKLSIEGHEVNALKGAADFFRTVLVKYVIIEFSTHKRMLSAFQINDLLKSYGMRPVLPEEKLKARTFVKWPNTILWERR